jgi:hypothetical protein
MDGRVKRTAVRFNFWRGAGKAGTPPVVKVHRGMGHETRAFFSVIAGPPGLAGGQPGGKRHDPAIHVVPQKSVLKQCVMWNRADARVERGHDGGGVGTA